MADQYGFVPDDFGFKADDNFGFVPERETPSLQAVVPAPNEDIRLSPAPNLFDIATQRLKDVRSRELKAAREREAQLFTPQQIQRMDEGSVLENLMTAPPGIEAPQITPQQVKERFPSISDTTSKVIAGLAQTGAGVWNFMLSPAGVAATTATAGAALPGIAGGVGKVTIGAFAVDAFRNMPKAIEELDAAVKSGDAESIARTSSALAVNTAVLAGAGKATLRNLERPAVSELTPKTAEALSETPSVPSDVRGAEPSGQPLGITPPGGELLGKIIERVTPPSPGVAPEVKIDTAARIPRLQPYEAEKAIASSPEGMARVPILGALVDPRATAKTPADVSVITRAYSLNKGRTFAAMWAESQWRNRDLFKADKSGTIELTNGERGYISDVIEAEIRDPGSQSISQAQRDWINNEWKPLLEEGNRMLQEEGVKEVVTEEFEFNPENDYFPRPAIGKVNVPEAQARGQSGGGRPGGAPFFEKTRYYKTEFEGARPPAAGETKQQIIYDPDAISRATKWLLGVYRSVADHRLANDVALGGEKAVSVEALQERYKAQRETMSAEELTEFDSQLASEAMYPIWGVREPVMVAPAFMGKIYPIESVQRLRKAYGDEIRGWVQAANNITAAAKAMTAVGDLSAPLIQGAAMLGSNPVKWARATVNSFRSLFDPNVTAKILERPEYKVAAQEFSQSGGTFLQLQDFLAGMTEGKGVTRIPGYGRFVEATGRAYGTFLDLAKLELWRSWKPVTEAKDLPRLAETIENAMFTGRMEAIGLNPHRAVGERVMLFAPMYYRGAGSLISSAFQRGIQGRVARQMLGGYMAAGTLVTFGAWSALGLTEEQMIDRLDPRKGNFMKIPVEFADGKRVEVGIGNVLTQLIRLGGQAADFHTTDKAIDTGVEGNPYLRFLQGRAAFFPGLAIELALGRDYMANRITAPESIARRFMPFALQALFPNEELPASQRVMDSAFSFFGLNAFPESEYAAQLRQMDEAAQETHKKPFMELNLRDRANAVQEFKKRPDYQKREPTMRDMERFLHIDQERRKALEARLNEETRKALEDFGLDVGTYRSTVTIQGLDVPLSKEEQKRYEELIAEEYNRFKIPESVEKAIPSVREKWWQKASSELRERARHKLMQEIARK